MLGIVKHHLLWIGFAACLAVAAGAMGWVSVAALRLEEAESTARRQAALEENVRLALWRMDSALAPVIAQESARPFSAYGTLGVLSMNSPYGVMGTIHSGEMLSPSTLLGESPPYVLVHFQFDPNGSLTSPRTPAANDRSLVVPRYLAEEDVTKAEKHLERLATLTDRGRLLAKLPSSTASPTAIAWMPETVGESAGRPIRSSAPWPALALSLPTISPTTSTTSILSPLTQGRLSFSPSAISSITVGLGRPNASPNQAVSALGANAGVSNINNFSMQEAQELQRRRQNDLQTRGRGSVEYDERNRAVAQNAGVIANGGISWNNAPPRNDLEMRYNAVPAVTSNLTIDPALADLAIAIGPTDVTGVLMTPLWLDGHLVLARRIAFGGREYVQGCLLDWPAIRAWLLASVDDLLPKADLRPQPDARPEKEARMLAALPAELVPAPPPAGTARLRSPIRLSLAIAWGGMLAAAAAVASLLWGILRLSQRRAAFVSAVTHELRTPLTTFHMYTEMLTERMVPPEQEQEYLRTLRAEASRLSHLVENVLAYARLERGRPGGQIETVAVADMLEPIQQRLAERAAQAGMELVVDEEDAARATVVRTSPSVVEQILFNLVDNACKYAATATDRRIHLTLRPRKDAVELCVRDHGPGIVRHAARRLFAPFAKSAREAANSAPGVGLGLALSRRLARDIGARLVHDAAVTNGASFTLALPAA